nr:immunoglobulin heavy chain junction region [Macaca mulatta]MOX60007.1 immunoglobulin heavy chain junction region [Macaca mulatta]MOX60141.1 immunoglobulin heavy chain junction region [Macaca mulatta]MOX61628.1 immunoglobulin heavy chain junction region [Macaca mulatta]MOX62167.1 immunoglobulin heavy chain junction region [Macaca mulatta]
CAREYCTSDSCAGFLDSW